MKTGFVLAIAEVVNYAIAIIIWLQGLSNSWVIFHIIGVSFFLIIAGYCLWKLYEWNKEDEAAKRQDFINTIQAIQEAQKNMTHQAITLHVQDLKDNFFRKLIPILRKDDIDISEIESLLNYEFDHYVSYMKSNEENIEELIERIELHKSDDILALIRYEQNKAKRKAKQKEKWNDLSNRIGHELT